MRNGDVSMVFFGALLTLIGLGAFAYVFGSRGRESSHHAAAETPLDTLKRRYVNGQVDREAFLIMRRDLRK